MTLTDLLHITLKSASENALWRILEGRPVRLDVLSDGTVTAQSDALYNFKGAMIFRLNNLRPNKKRKPDG